MARESPQHSSNIDLTKDSRSVTGTYRHGSEVVSLVAWTIPELHAKAHRLFGDEVECLSISTPRSIFNDLTGITRERLAAKGMYKSQFA